MYYLLRLKNYACIYLIIKEYLLNRLEAKGVFTLHLYQERRRNPQLLSVLPETYKGFAGQFRDDYLLFVILSSVHPFDYLIVSSGIYINVLATMRLTLLWRIVRVTTH